MTGNPQQLDPSKITKPIDNTENQKDGHREIVFSVTPGEKQFWLKLQDSRHTWNNLPLGKVSTTAKGKYPKGSNVIVPVIPLCYTTPDADKQQAKILRQGWLYVFLNGKLWRELEVAGSGYMSDVNLQHNHDIDIRQATGHHDNRVLLPYKVFGKLQTAEMAFSEVQWSWARINKLQDDAELRQQRMQEIDLSGYDAKFEPKMHEGNKARIENVEHAPELYHLALQRKSNIPVVYLLDSVGVADKLAEAHEKDWYEMESLVASLATGVKPNPWGSHNSLRTESEGDLMACHKTPSESLAAHRRQIKAQHEMAKLAYQFGYNDSKLFKKYGKHMSRERIEKLLGVEERKDIRVKIRQSRAKLAEWVQTEQYQTTLEDYKENIAERILAGREVVCNHHRRLDQPAYAKDKHLLLAEDIKKEAGEEQADKARVVMDETFEGQNTAGELLTEPVEVDENNLAMKAGAIVTMVVDMFAERTKSDTKYLPRLAVFLNAVSGCGIKHYEVKEVVYNLEQQIPKGYRVVHKGQRWQFATRVDEGGTSTQAKATLDTPEAAAALAVANQKPATGAPEVHIRPRNFRLLPAVGPASKSAAITETGAEFRVLQLVEKDLPLPRTADAIRKSWYYSKGFFTLLGLLEAVNTAAAVKQLLKNGANFRDLTNFTSAIAGVGSFVYSAMELNAKLAGQPLSRAAMSNSKLLIRGGYVLGGIVSSIDATSNFCEKDVDAAAAHAFAAGISFGLACAAFFGVAAFTIPGLVLLAGAIVLAAYLEDDPLEQWAKHGPFQRSGGTEERNEYAPEGYRTTGQALREHNSLVDPREHSDQDLWGFINGQAINPVLTKKKWQDLTQAQAALFDYLFAFDVKMIMDTSGGKVQSMGRVVRASVGAVRVNITFRHFRPQESEFEHYLRIYPNGLKGNFDEVFLNPEKYQVKEDEDTSLPKTVILEYPLVQKDLSDQAKIVFYSRLKLHGDLFIPSKAPGGTFRYVIAIGSGTVRTTYASRQSEVTQIEYGNLEEVLGKI